MSTESSWDDYLSTAGSNVVETSTTSGTTGVEVPAAPMAEPVVPEPVLDAVESDLSGAANAQDWSAWHAASGDSWAASAQGYVDYALENAAAGYGDIAESALRTAADHAGIADANYTVSTDYTASAGSYLDSAVQEMTPYDTSATFGAAE